MIYQATMKEKAAKRYGKPFDYFYHWPYANWEPIQHAIYYGKELPIIPESTHMRLNNHWPFQTVSEGTLDPDDLAISFCRHEDDIQDYFATSSDDGIKERLTKLRNDASELRLYGKLMGYEVKSDLIDEIVESFDLLCPEEYYFGAHPDDGACFGYWRHDDE